MLTELRIENFKAWPDTGPIHLAPLTVFFGANSSGKSSLHQLLLMLRQTIESPDRRRVLHTGDPGTPVELGSFDDVVFRHDSDATLSFSLAWTLQRRLEIRDARSDVAYSGDSMRFAGAIRETATGQLMVKEMRYALVDTGAARVTIGMRPREGKRGKYELFAEDYGLTRNQGRPWDLPPPDHFHGFPDEAVAYFQNTAFTSDLTLALDRALGALTYLGPLRDRPRRLYTWSGEEPDHVGWRGERSIEAILAARQRMIHPGYRRKGQPFEQVIARWLRSMGLIQSFEVQAIGDRRKEYEVRVKTVGSREDVLLTDIGFGVSQVLPVLVQCFYAEAGSTVILEQPEIHLHPAVQTDLADLFIEAVQARERGEDRNLQLIVESHSEHFLRRLMRRVAEGRIAPDSLALYFCRPTGAGSRIEPLQVDLFGNILNWPDDFFGDQMEEIAAKEEAAVTRKIELVRANGGAEAA